MGKLTALRVKTLTAPGLYGDGQGLWLQVSGRGGRSWIFRYRSGGKQREMGLGSAHTVSLAEARERARECRRLLADGKDPIEERRRIERERALERGRAMTFSKAAQAYIDAHRSTWKNAKHAQQWTNTLTQYAHPVLGDLPVAEIETAHILKVLSPIWTQKTETAVRLRGRIEAILDWATAAGYRTGDNPARWRGHLENLLADPARSKRVKHFPALPWQEMGSFMAALRAQAGIAARALEFCILTAARSGEVRGARWSEIDLEARLWVIPAERMKARREHRVPLSDAALAVLRALPRVEGTDLVFPGQRGAPLSDMSLTAVLRRMGRGDITVHGFRSTFRDWAAEATHFPREVAEAALAHVLTDKTEAAYRRGDLLIKRRRLMDAWAAHCNRPTTAAVITPLNRVAN